MRKLFFAVFMLEVLFTNCQNMAEGNRLQVSKTAKENIVYATWEDGDLLQHIFSPHSLCSPWAGAVTDSIARKGKKAVRFELRATDSICGSSKRAELYINNKLSAKENFTWYAWSEFLPADYAFDKINEVHFQLHDYDWSGPPLIGFWVSEDRWRLVQTYNTNDVNDKKSTIKSHDLGPVVKGKWVDWVLHVKFSVEEDGEIQMWRNDSLVLEVKGANFNRINSHPAEAPYMKFGLYKWRWKDNPGPVYPDKRVTYFDEVRMGKEGLELEDFIIGDEDEK